MVGFKCKGYNPANEWRPVAAAWLFKHKEAGMWSCTFFERNTPDLLLVLDDSFRLVLAVSKVWPDCV